MKRFFASRILELGSLAGISFCLCAAAQEREPAPITPVAPAAPGTSVPVATGHTTDQTVSAKPHLSKSVLEILKMVDAGVSKEVIRTYVENARITGHPTGDDLIALKQHGVEDDITIVLLKRRPESPVRNSVAAAATAGGRAPATGAVPPNQFYPDPESYDYFQRYYLYPRTMASVYERLGYLPGPYFPGYGTPGSYSYPYR